MKLLLAAARLRDSTNSIQSPGPSPRVGLGPRAWRPTKQKGPGARPGPRSLGQVLYRVVLVGAVSWLVGCGGPSPQSAAQDVGSDGAFSDQPGGDAGQGDQGQLDQAQADGVAKDGAQSCNGSPLLCDRPLDQVAFAAAHNAMSAADASWALPNHPHGMVKQLDFGIRAFLIDLHSYDVEDGVMAKGETALCHGYCMLGAQKWSDATAEINAWLTQHPREVIAFMIEDYVPIEKVADGLASAGMLQRVYAHPVGQGWPTLNQLIAKDKRVVLMTQSAPKAGAPPWQHGYHDILFDNPYAAEKVGDFSCAVLRGSPGHGLSQLNHFLTVGLQHHQGLSEQANTLQVLGGQAQKCRKQWGRQVNFVAVDWYTAGALLQVVQELNGLPP